jgi:hypothetical protein
MMVDGQHFGQSFPNSGSSTNHNCFFHVFELEFSLSSNFHGFNEWVYQTAGIAGPYLPTVKDTHYPKTVKVDGRVSAKVEMENSERKTGNGF